MADKTTETFVALMEATFFIAPPPPDLPVVPVARGLLRRPVPAVAWGFLAVLLVVGGVIGISIRGPSSEPLWAAPTGQHEAVGIDAYWEWATSDATELQVGVVAVTRLGPVPSFDAAEHGPTQRLIGAAETADDPNLDRPDSEAETPIAYVGSLQDAGTQVYMYRRDTASGKELMLCLQDDAGTTCAGTKGLSISSLDDEPSIWLAAAGPADSQPWNRIALAMLHKDASVVVVELTDGRSFSQRPRGGVAAFEIPGSEPVSIASITVLDAGAKQITPQAGNGDDCQPALTERAPLIGPEARAESGDEIEVWALIFNTWDLPNGDPILIPARQEAKIVWRSTGDGEMLIDAIGPDGTVVGPDWGPDVLLDSNWDRPGDEWGTGWTFPEAGCWTFRISRGDSSAILDVDVFE